MQFPFETTTKDGRKATVLGTMPNGLLVGYLNSFDVFSPRDWNPDGSHPIPALSITLPLQIKPLTTYRMRNGQLAWTTGLVGNGWICGLTKEGVGAAWLIKDGRWREGGDTALDLIEELLPGTTE